MVATFKLFLDKTVGCYREFGLKETFRRIILEPLRSVKKSGQFLDISYIKEDFVIGAAPRSIVALKYLKNLGFSHVIDLRAERKRSDILIDQKDIAIAWVPTYDDWRPKPLEYFEQLTIEIKNVLLSGDDAKILICCGSGEHRAPLAGVLALVVMGYPLETARDMIQRARPQAELLPIYISSLRDFLQSTRTHNL